MITLISRQTIDVFPEVADRYLDFNTFEHQRDYRPWHVEVLVDKMKSGLFRFGEVAFCKIKNKGTDVMLNGQHVCLAIIKFNKPVPCVIEKYQVDSPLERSELFRQFEILARGMPEMVRVEAGALEITWPRWITNLVVAALGIDQRKKATGIIWHGVGGSTPSKKDSAVSPANMTKELKVSKLRYYIKEGDFICKILSLNGSISTRTNEVKHIARAPIAFMMMETWRKNKAMANKFWEEVRDGEGLNKGDSTKALREYLIEASGSKFKIGYTRPDNHQYIYRTSVAWNAFIDGRKTSLRYRPDLQPPPMKAYSKATASIGR